MDDDVDVTFDKSLTEPQWFALQVLSNQENKVQSALEVLVKDRHWHDIVGEILVPSEKVVDIRDGKKRSRVRKFYPGYVFIKMKMYDDKGEFFHDVFSSIRNTRGVVKFVGKEGPVPLKKEEIEAILTKVAAVTGKDVPRVSFEIGDVVKINDGPFLNLTGTVEGIDTEQGRLMVSVSMFGRSTPVELEFWQTERFVGEEN